MTGRIPKSTRWFLIMLLVFVGCQSKELTSAKIYMQASRWDKAKEYLDRAIEANPNDAEAHYWLGEYYARHGEFKSMSASFETSLAISDEFHLEIITVRENHWSEQYNRGITALNREDYFQAASYLKQAIVIDESNHDAHKQLALCLIKAGRPDEALAVYQDLLRKSPQDIELLISSGNLHHSRQNYEDAAVLLKRVLVQEPSHRDALANLALVLDFLDRQDEAHQYFEKALEVNPEDTDLIFLFGIHHYEEKRFEEAIGLFGRVLDLNPIDFDALSNTGSAYLSMAESIRLDLRGLPKQSSTVTEAALMKSAAIEKYRQAIVYYENALKLQPNHPILWQNLGASYLSVGQTEKGEKAFLKAEQLKVEAAN